MKEEMEIPNEEFNYSSFFDFDGETDPQTVIGLTMIGICPTVKLSNFVFSFGECPMHDYRDMKFTLTNVNEDKYIDFGFERCSPFSFNPPKGDIEGGETKDFIASFRPKNFGSFAIEYHLFLMKSQYRIPLKMEGKCSNKSEKCKVVRGLESLPGSFVLEPKFLSITDSFDYESLGKPRKRKNKMLLSWQSLANSHQLIEEVHLNLLILPKKCPNL